MFDFSIVTKWVDNLLRQTCGLGDFWTLLIECVLVGAVVLTLYALIAMFMIFFERKVCAWFQCRLGPMRVGPWGIFQVMADVLKMLIKEIELQNYLFNRDVYEIPPRERLEITDNLRKEMIEIYSGMNIY